MLRRSGPLPASGPLALAAALTAGWLAPAARAAGSDAVAAPDLCAPCVGAASCFSGVCLQSDGAAPVCSQRCQGSGQGNCPASFTCEKVTGFPNPVCRPTAASVCQGIYTGATRNSVCGLPAAVSGLASDLVRDCQAGLACFGLGSPAVKYCVPACTRSDPDVQCTEPGATCCFGQGSSGACLTAVAGVTDGGCFRISRAGESCTVPEQSICAAGTQCLSPSDDPALSRCYRACTDSSQCLREETCATFGSRQVCCNAKMFDGSSSATCLPTEGACRRQVGVACDVNDDCASGLCIQAAAGGVCSQSCQLDRDCPAAGSDVNGDGQPDGGGSCKTISPGNNVCMPNGNSAAPPDCARLADANTPAAAGPPGGGGGCSAGGGSGGDISLLAATAGTLAALRGGRRRGGRCRAPPPRRA